MPSSRKEPVTEVDRRFIKMVDILINDKKVKNQSQFGYSINAYATLLPDIRRGKRSVTIQQLLDTVNLYGINGNFFFSDNEPLYKEEAQRQVDIKKAGDNSIIGEKNKKIFHGGNGGINGLKYVEYADKLIYEELPEECRTKCKDVNRMLCEGVKVLYRHSKKLEDQIHKKNEQLLQIKDKYINLLEKNK